MSDNNQDNSPEIQLRSPRYISHALVELKKSRWLPFGIHSAVLLDISTGGVKIELTGDVPLIPGDIFWLTIPLAPLQIYAPEKLVCKMEVRWFDNDRFRAGGSLRNLKPQEIEIVEHIIFNMTQKHEKSRHIAQTA